MRFELFTRFVTTYHGIHEEGLLRWNVAVRSFFPGVVS